MARLFLLILALSLAFQGLASFRAIRPLGLGWQVYEDRVHGFRLYYPSDFVPLRASEPPMSLLAGAVVGFKLADEGYYRGTNLNGAAIIVSAQKVKGLKGCLQLDIAGMRSEYPQRIVVNGVIFYRQEFLEAGVGNLYRLISYRTLHGEVCYIVALFIHWGNLKAFTPGTVVQFDEQAVLQELEGVFRTFQFSGSS